jgi:hypothetical protein
MSRGARIAEELWGSGPGGTRVFERADVERLPAPARLYMEHAIAPGTPLANAVRLRLRGEIKLRRWLPFTAEQVVHRVHGFIWRASARMNGLAIRGFDRLVDGEGEMQWKLLGLFPVMTASGPDISRSAAGRFVTESAWLPSMFCSDGVSWTTEGQVVAVAHVNVFGEPAHFAITVDEIGRALSVKLARWGNPEGTAFHYADFGAIAEEERTFAGFTVPSRIRAGWHFGTERFERDGEFFRATVEEAEYR